MPGIVLENRKNLMIARKTEGWESGQTDRKPTSQLARQTDRHTIMVILSTYHIRSHDGSTSIIQYVTQWEPEHLTTTTNYIELCPLRASGPNESYARLYSLFTSSYSV